MSLMKLVHLFNIDILSRVELIVLLEDLLCRHQDLIQDFRTTLAIEEPEWDEDDDGGDDDVDAALDPEDDALLLRAWQRRVGPLQTRNNSSGPHTMSLTPQCTTVR